MAFLQSIIPWRNVSRFRNAHNPPPALPRGTGRGPKPDIIDRVSVTTTNGIRVAVESSFLPERSSPKEGQFLFAYHVRISNVGSAKAQLVSRHWIITNADGESHEVKGPGVVGEQPVLEPGSSFEYTSYCPLPTQMGVMHGSYTMITEAGEAFEAEIAPFTLATPNALH
jgi:ApaG protein